MDDAGGQGRRQAVHGRHTSSVAQLELPSTILRRNIQQVAWVENEISIKYYFYPFMRTNTCVYVDKVVYVYRYSSVQ